MHINAPYAITIFYTSLHRTPGVSDRGEFCTDDRAFPPPRMKWTDRGTGGQKDRAVPKMGYAGAHSLCSWAKAERSLFWSFRPTGMSKEINNHEILTRRMLQNLHNTPDSGFPMQAHASEARTCMLLPNLMTPLVQNYYGDLWVSPLRLLRP